MANQHSLKIDIFPHILPPKYLDALLKVSPSGYPFKPPIPPVYDLEERFRIMDRYAPLAQVLTLSRPAPEEIADPKKSVELARLANDEMAELVIRHPDRFVATVATLPLNNIDAALEEMDRAVKDLNCKGVQIYNPANEKPLDSPDLVPLYEKMASYNLPIWIHPGTSPKEGDELALNGAARALTWPYETTIAMARLVFSGIFDRLPNLKFIIHHCGGMVPSYWERMTQFSNSDYMRRGIKPGKVLTRPLADYLKLFYTDTALYGNTAGLMCAYDFFGADHLLFGTDMPLGDATCGDRNTRETINAIEQMDISDDDKRTIFEKNARGLLRLPL
jgi:predicted TIM-barrel fold metal-dependent hydrolase